MALCWSENAQLSGDSRKALKDSTVMNEEEASFSFVVVENFVKIVKRSLDPKVDLDHKSKNVRKKKKREKKEITPFVFHA